MVDDAAILWLGSYIFTEICPPEVVEEHMKALAAANTKRSETNDDVVEGETTFHLVRGCQNGTSIWLRE